MSTNRRRTYLELLGGLDMRLLGVLKSPIPSSGFKLSGGTLDIGEFNIPETGNIIIGFTIGSPSILTKLGTAGTILHGYYYGSTYESSSSLYYDVQVNLSISGNVGTVTLVYYQIGVNGGSAVGDKITVSTNPMYLFEATDDRP